MYGSRQDKSNAKWLLKLSNSIPKLHGYEVDSRNISEFRKWRLHHYIMPHHLTKLNNDNTHSTDTKT